MGITQIYAQCYQCTGTNSTSFKIGSNTSATGDNSFAGGYLSGTSTDNSFVFGNQSTVNGLRGIALGNLVQVSQTDGIAIGKNLFSDASNNYLFGQNLYSNAANSITIGLGSSSSKLLSNDKAGSIMFGVSYKPSLTIVKPANADVGYLGIGTTDPQQKVHLDEGNLLITSVNSGTTNAPTGALLFGDVIDEFYPNGKWSIEYLNSANPTYGGQGLNFRKLGGKSPVPQVPSVLFLSDNGRIGIGNKEPQAKLDVAGSFMAQSADINGNIVITSILNPTNELEKNAIVFGYDKGGVQIFPPPGKWGIERVGTGRDFGLNFWRYGYYAPAKDGEETRGYEHRSVMFFDENDNVGIGTDKPQAKLDVAGDLKALDATINNILTTKDLKTTGLLCAKEIRVMLFGAPCWPDYVFGKDYNLLPLNEVEQFITENQHLPNVPSAAEVEANGVNIGEMNAILLKKMEEMTLYIIDLQKQIDELKNR